MPNLKRYRISLQAIENKLNNVQSEIDEVLLLSEKSIEICIKGLRELRDVVIEKGFQNREAEIIFFKEIKPKIVSNLIYNNNIYTIETNRPNGSTKIKRKYIQMELRKLKNFFYENLDFYRYYRTGSTYFDYKYFIRGKQDIRLNLDAFVYEADPDFSTSHDFKISTILANDLLQVYLENELTKIDFQPTNKESGLISRNQIKWTGNKVSLIELMYALHQSGVFNNGQSDIKAIATYFENIFNVDLGNYYRTYLELKIRQDRTKFLDSLRENFIRKIEDEEK
ncbi:MAG TPA: RteC domain-containing protein [Candidatus Dojkabacteria bacterium]|nr:RteC domain-containing protein [Candidatus Dojkabacteria bacterium]